MGGSWVWWRCATCTSWVVLSEVQTLRASRDCDPSDSLSASCKTPSACKYTVCLLKISAKPDCRAHAKAEFGQDLVSELEDFANSHRVEVLGLVARIGLFFKFVILGNQLGWIVDGAVCATEPTRWHLSLHDRAEHLPLQRGLVSDASR
jgi:hypothetical protein